MEDAYVHYKRRTESKTNKKTIHIHTNHISFNEMKQNKKKKANKIYLKIIKVVEKKTTDCRKWIGKTKQTKRQKYPTEPKKFWFTSHNSVLIKQQHEKVVNDHSNGDNDRHDYHQVNIVNKDEVDVDAENDFFFFLLPPTWYWVAVVCLKNKQMIMIMTRMMMRLKAIFTLLTLRH